LQQQKPAKCQMHTSETENIFKNLTISALTSWYWKD